MERPWLREVSLYICFAAIPLPPPAKPAKVPKPAPELKRDLQIIRMRGVLDPKRFYRSSDMKKELPKYFQVGTLIGGAEDAGAKKKPRGTMLQDVMGDAKIRKRTKEQFGKIQAVKALSARPRKGERGAARSSKGKKKKR